MTLDSKTPNSVSTNVAQRASEMPPSVLMIARLLPFLWEFFCALLTNRYDCDGMNQELESGEHPSPVPFRQLSRVRSYKPLAVFFDDALLSRGFIMFFGNRALKCWRQCVISILSFAG